ncbi:MAG: sugar phosphate isomerase/epimerase family protein [Candidatus Latescibacterota bacterium]|nr:sugar phosphate isomerase/epimerase family protein [Candidatus Latescibacterota bacterium]
MNIGLCAWSFTSSHAEAGRALNPHDPDGLRRLAQQHGLAAIEGASAWFADWSQERRQEFGAMLAADGMGVFVDTGADYAKDISSLLTAIDVAADIGATLVRTTLSRVVEGDRRKFGREGWVAHLNGLVEPLKRAMSHADDHAIAVGIENHQDLCSHELVELAEAVSSDGLGVTLDCGNTYAVGETPESFVTRIMPILKHVHLKDYQVHPTNQGFRLKRCPLGEGIVDWVQLLGQIDARTAASGTSVAGCIELGASTTRHIRIFNEDWWGTFPDRPFHEGLNAIADLHRAARPADEDWRTPHEREESALLRADYELEQIRRSVEHLRQVELLPAVSTQR